MEKYKYTFMISYFMKNIRVTERLHRELIRIKYDNELENMTEVIEFCMRKLMI